MSTWTKSSKIQAFGQKGANDTAKSFAESLLTGKPVARAARRDTAPKLKPRTRPRFGRKFEQLQDGANLNEPLRHSAWRLRAVVLVVLSVAAIFSLWTVVVL